MESDIRYKILKRLESKSRSTAEYNSNEFLSELHDDLGTIKRSLVELMREGLIYESNIDDYKKSVSYGINTSTSINDNPDFINQVKSPERLNGDVGDHGKKISDIRLIISIKGLRWLEEYEKFGLDKKSVRLKVNWFPVTIVAAVLGLIGGGWKIYDETIGSSKQEYTTPRQQYQSKQTTNLIDTIVVSEIDTVYLDTSSVVDTTNKQE